MEMLFAFYALCDGNSLVTKYQTLKCGWQLHISTAGHVSRGGVSKWGSYLSFAKENSDMAPISYENLGANKHTQTFL